MGVDAWNAFQHRFKMPRILEFYAATEGKISLYNAEGMPGAIGRVPLFLAHRFPLRVVKIGHAKSLSHWSTCAAEQSRARDIPLEAAIPRVLNGRMSPAERVGHSSYPNGWAGAISKTSQS
jgi:hypothetical protein